jgi:hypothetical protein
MQEKPDFRPPVPPATKGRMLRLFTAIAIPEDVAETLALRKCVV